MLQTQSTYRKVETKSTHILIAVPTCSVVKECIYNGVGLIQKGSEVVYVRGILFHVETVESATVIQLFSLLILYNVV